MSRPLLVISLATAAILAAVVFLYGSSRSGDAESNRPQASDSIRGPSPVTSASDSIARLQSSNFGDLGTKSKTLDAVQSLSSLSRVASSSLEDRGQALNELRLAVTTCESVKLRSALPTRAETQRRAKGQIDRGLLAWQRFCDTQGESADALLKEQLALPASNEVAQAMGLRLMAIEKPSEDAVPLAEKLVNTAKEPIALEAAADVLFGLDRDLPQTKSVPFPANLQYREMQVDAQRLALEMYTCQVRGGCGPGGLYTLLRCNQPCSRGDVNSLTELWNKEYPTEVVSYARQLSAVIASQR